MPFPRFHFRLRTLLIVVTAFCCWLGYQVNVVRRRAGVERWLEVHEIPYTPNGEESHVWCFIVDDANLPWYRKLLDDHAVTWFAYPLNATAEEVDSVQSAFPEAKGHPLGF